MLLCNDGFAVTASAVTRGALWSAERLTRASVEAARRIPRENRFHLDARPPPDGRAELANHRNSGFDCGHMTLSGDTPISRRLLTTGQRTVLLRDAEAAERQARRQLRVMRAR